MKKLSVVELAKVEAQVTREEYCGTLSDLLLGGGYQGDIAWGWKVWQTNCGNHIA